MNITSRIIRHVSNPDRRYYVRHYNESSDTWTLESLDGTRKGEASAVHVHPVSYEVYGVDGWAPMSDTVTAESYVAWKLFRDDAPLVIMVPDSGDPCGIRKIPREVETVYQHGTEWCIAFAGAYLFPMIHRTAGNHPYQVTDAAPATESGPCEGCRAFAASQAAEAAAKKQQETGDARARDAHFSDATTQGVEDGGYAAQEFDVNGTPVPDNPRVPPHFADASMYYLSGFATGVESYDPSAR